MVLFSLAFEIPLLLVCLMNVSQDLRCTECLIHKKEEGTERTACPKPRSWQQPERRHWGTAVRHNCGSAVLPVVLLQSGDPCPLGVLFWGLLRVMWLQWDTLELDHLKGPFQPKTILWFYAKWTQIKVNSNAVATPLRLNLYLFMNATLLWSIAKHSICINY